MGKWTLVCALALTACLACGAACAEDVMMLNEVTHSVFYAPQYAAMELGFFAEEGIVIDLVNGGGSDRSMTAVLAGEADVGLMGPETAVYVINQGKSDPPVVIGQLTQKDGSFLVCRTPADAFSWEDVRGKTVIGGRVGGMPLMTLTYVLAEKGIDPERDLNVRTDIQFNLMAGAFEGSDAEYVTLFEPTASLCEREGKGYIAAAVGAQTGNVSYTAYIAQPAKIRENRDLYLRFLRAVAKGQEWVRTHSAEEIAEAIAGQFPDSDVPLLTEVCKNYLAIDAWKATPEMDQAAYENMLKIIEYAGELSAKPDFSVIADNSLAEEIMRGQEE